MSSCGRSTSACVPEWSRTSKRARSGPAGRPSTTRRSPPGAKTVSQPLPAGSQSTRPAPLLGVDPRGAPPQRQAAARGERAARVAVAEQLELAPELGRDPEQPREGDLLAAERDAALGRFAFGVVDRLQHDERAAVRAPARAVERALDLGQRRVAARARARAARARSRPGRRARLRRPAARRAGRARRRTSARSCRTASPRPSPRRPAGAACSAARTRRPWAAAESPDSRSARATRSSAPRAAARPAAPARRRDRARPGRAARRDRRSRTARTSRPGPRKPVSHGAGAPAGFAEHAHTTSAASASDRRRAAFIRGTIPSRCQSSDRDSWPPHVSRLRASPSAIAVVYARALAGPFVFDDQTAIVGNATLRALAAARRRAGAAARHRRSRAGRWWRCRSR